LSSSRITIRQKVIEPIGESRQDDEIFFALAKRLNLDYTCTTMEEFLDWQLEPFGLTFERFKRREKGFIEFPMKYRKYEENGFRTSSGKVELYSDGLEKAGLDPLPVYREPPESPYSTPELARDYPLILTTGAKYPVFFHSEYRNLTWLREIAPENALEINPETASKLSIKHGDTVMVESLRGKMKVKARISEGIDPRVVHIPHGWIGEAIVNILTSDKPPYDPAIGTYQLRGILCRVSNVGDIQN
jgi:thiosulfate reductase/polysulfide reductase chain A